MSDREMAAANIEVVRDFLHLLEQCDFDGAARLLHPEVRYQNVPAPPLRGRDSSVRCLRLLGHCSAFEARIHHIAADGAIVLTERTDAIEMGPVRIAFWVCGTFEVRGGQIILWRDRFDFGDCLVATVRGLVRALISVVRR